jgi:hypothetical protein
VCVRADRERRNGEKEKKGASDEHMNVAQHGTSLHFLFLHMVLRLEKSQNGIQEQRTRSRKAWVNLHQLRVADDGSSPDGQR